MPSKRQLRQQVDDWQYMAQRLYGAVTVLRDHVDTNHTGDFRELTEEYWGLALRDGYAQTMSVGEVTVAPRLFDKPSGQFG